MIQNSALFLLILFGLHLYTRSQMHPKKVENASDTNLVKISFIFSVLLALFTMSVIWYVGDSASIGLFIALSGVYWSSAYSLLKAWRDTE